MAVHSQEEILGEPETHFMPQQILGELDLRLMEAMVVAAQGLRTVDNNDGRYVRGLQQIILTGMALAAMDSDTVVVSRADEPFTWRPFVKEKALEYAISQSGNTILRRVADTFSSSKYDDLLNTLATGVGAAVAIPSEEVPVAVSTGILSMLEPGDFRPPKDDQQYFSVAA